MAILSVCIIFICLSPKVNALVFSDVDKNTLGEETFNAIMYVADNGIMTGVGGGLFSPETELTRAQVVQILYKHSGYAGTVYSVPFTDVTSGKWFYNAVSWAYHFGITSGTSETIFSPNTKVTREQTICFLYRYATSYLNYDTCSSTALLAAHSDQGTISNYARIPMNWALKNGIIITELTSDPLYPKQYLPRKDSALYTCRFESRVVGFTANKCLSFTNSAQNFYNSSDESKPLAISSSLIQQMKGQINKYYGSGSTKALQLATLIDKWMLQEWSGSCNGIAFATFYDMTGKHDFNRYVGNYNSMNAVPLPKNKKAVRDAIFYYQAAAYVGQYFRSDYAENSIINGIYGLKNNVNKYGPTVISYFWKTTDQNGNEQTTGHTLIVEEIVSTNTGYRIKVVQSGLTPVTTKYIIADGSSYTIDGHTISTFGFYSTAMLKQFGFIDIDGEYNNLLYH